MDHRYPNILRRSLDIHGNATYAPKTDEWGHVILWETEGKPTGCDYSDRLHQFNPEKHNTLCKKHFGDAGQYWGSRSPEKVEAFLSDYHGKPIKLLKVLTGENRSNGYPFWVFMYSE